MKKLLSLIILLGILTITSIVIAGEYSHMQPKSTLSDIDVVAILAVIFGVFVFYLIPSMVCSIAAKRKGLTMVGFFFLSLIFTPIIGFLAVIAFDGKSEIRFK